MMINLDCNKHLTQLIGTHDVILLSGNNLISTTQFFLKINIYNQIQSSIRSGQNKIIVIIKFSLEVTDPLIDITAINQFN